MNHYQEKKEALYQCMEELVKQDLCIAFSGGVDSSLLIKLAKLCADRQQTGARIYAVTFDTMLHPACDLELARQVAEETGVFHEVLFIDELEEAGIRYNPENRCYLCKKALFSRLQSFAAQKGISRILEGSNEDDLHVYRPGIQAVRQLGILSPLAQCGFTKEEVRKLAAELGISVASRPSTPCLATRLPYGAELRQEILEKIGAAEAYLREQGFSVVRLRLHGDIGRIEIPKEDFSRLLQQSGEISGRLKELGIPYVTLDLQGFRSGSMDENLKIKK